MKLGAFPPSLSITVRYVEWLWPSLNSKEISLRTKANVQNLMEWNVQAYNMSLSG